MTHNGQTSFHRMRYTIVVDLWIVVWERIVQWVSQLKDPVTVEHSAILYPKPRPDLREDEQFRPHLDFCLLCAIMR